MTVPNAPKSKARSLNGPTKRVLNRLAKKYQGRIDQLEIDAFQASLAGRRAQEYAMKQEALTLAEVVADLKAEVEKL